MAQTKTTKIKIKEEEQVFNESEGEFVHKVPDAEDATSPLQLAEEQKNTPASGVDTSHDAPVKKVKISVLLKDLEPKVKVLYYTLLILTFGLFARTIRKRIEENTENVLKTSNEIPFNMEIFMNALGGKTNVLATEATISSVKITFKDINLVNKEKVKELSQRGILVSEDKITILFGNYSEALKKAIDQECQLASTPAAVKVSQ